jgi:cytochrome c553
MNRPLLVLALLTGSCANAAGSGNAAAGRPLLSPLSILEVMRASIEIPADGLWAAQGADKLSEEDWQLADQDAVQLIGATTLASRGGKGKHDQEWVSKADWQGWMSDMLKTAVALRAAAKAQDAAKLSAAADHLQEICAACHAKYRPAQPSDGVARYPFYPKRELVK